MLSVIKYLFLNYFVKPRQYQFILEVMIGTIHVHGIKVFCSVETFVQGFHILIFSQHDSLWVFCLYL